MAGAADTFTVTFRGAMVQAVTADEFRGRISNVESGPVAALAGALVRYRAGTATLLSPGMPPGPDHPEA